MHVPPVCLEGDHKVVDPVVDLLVPPGDPWRRAHNKTQPQSAANPSIRTDGKFEVARLQNFTNGGLSALCKGASGRPLPAENAPDLSQVWESPAEQEKATSERSNHSSSTTQFNPNNGNQGTLGTKAGSEDHREVWQQSDDQRPIRSGHNFQLTASQQHSDASASAAPLDSSVDSPSSRRHTHYEAVLSSSTSPHAIGTCHVGYTSMMYG